MDARGEVPGPERVAALAREWIEAVDPTRSPLGAAADELGRLLDDADGLRFTMAFIDRVMRAPTPATAGQELHDLVQRRGTPQFLGSVDRSLLRVGAALGPVMAPVVAPLAVRRVRALTRHLIVPAEDPALARHLARRAAAGVRTNVNWLGEAVLGDREARRRLDRAVALLRRGDVDYTSVKVSAIASQLQLWGYDATLERVAERLRLLYRAAQSSSPAAFVNLDMEEYRDLDLTLDVFRAVLDEPEFESLDAGVVLQAYLPESFTRLRELFAWAGDRHGRSGGQIKVRIVKGANLAMERVDAEIHGWPQAPYPTKHEVDANWKRMVDWALDPRRLSAVRIGLASHNLFDVAWAHLLATDRGVAHRVDVEMLEGMAPGHAEAVRATTGNLLLYTPVVERREFQAAIAYLFRRLEENAAPENFLRHLFDLTPGSPDWESQLARFEQALAERWEVSEAPRRRQQRATEPAVVDLDRPFANEPDTDPALRANRRWMAEAVTRWSPPDVGTEERTIDVVDAAVDRANAGATRWGARSARDRASILEAAAGELARRRGALIATMVHEAGKPVAEADGEVSEAIDCARYYARSALELDEVDGARFAPLGVIVVTPPWNFPVAIAAGGILAALAAGNAVIVKPPPQTPGCVRLVVDALHEGGVPPEALQYLRVPEDEVGRRLITHPAVAGVLLTGAWETAELFRSWRADLALVAETSGKNALVITARADVDAAIADLVSSAFGHGGQKCSAASLAIVEAELYDDPAFARQLVDAVTSLAVGPATDLANQVGPLIGAPGPRLDRALRRLDPGETWLVEPRPLSDDGRVWQPGVRLGVAPGSWFHHTECFGPVLGIMRASGLEEATAWQNAVAYGLTGGIWSLDPREVEWWLEHVEVGNAYVNRRITGAIVGRQPFGGWKKSSVGPGAKAGGPNYVAQFGTWEDDGRPRRVQRPPLAVRDLIERAAESGVTFDDRLTDAVASDAWWWANVYGRGHDPSGLRFEQNLLRYRPLPLVVLRAGEGTDARDLVRMLAAALGCGTPVEVSLPTGVTSLSRLVSFVSVATRVVAEDESELAQRLAHDGVARIRAATTVGDRLRRSAATAGVHLDSSAVSGSGRVELARWLREQSVSRTRHRYGNLLGGDD